MISIVNLDLAEYVSTYFSDFNLVFLHAYKMVFSLIVVIVFVKWVYYLFDDI